MSRRVHPRDFHRAGRHAVRTDEDVLTQCVEAEAEHGRQVLVGQRGVLGHPVRPFLGVAAEAAVPAERADAVGGPVGVHRGHDLAREARRTGIGRRRGRRRRGFRRGSRGRGHRTDLIRLTH